MQKNASRKSAERFSDIITNANFIYTLLKDQGVKLSGTEMGYGIF